MLIFPFIDGVKKSKGDSFALIGEPLIPNAFITPSNLCKSNKEFILSISVISIF